MIRRKTDWNASSYFLRQLLGLLHGLLHNLRHCCRRFLRFALLKFIDLVTVVGMVRVVRVEEIKLWIVDLILTDSCFKLRSVPVKWQEINKIIEIVIIAAEIIQLTHMELPTWQQSWLSCQLCFGPQEVDIWYQRWASWPGFLLPEHRSVGQNVTLHLISYTC